MHSDMDHQPSSSDQATSCLDAAGQQLLFLRTTPRIKLNIAKCPLTRGLVRNGIGLSYGEAYASYKEVSKYTWSGSCRPFRCNVPIGVVTASCSRALVSGPIATPPVGAVLSMREAMLTVSPTIV
jgi:hypothetical protein